MFTKEIAGLTLANELANEAFPQIRGSKYGSDETFIATLRAIMHSRIGPEDRILMRLTSSYVSYANIEHENSGEMIKSFLRGTPIRRGESGILHIHSLNIGDNVEAFFRKIHEGIGVLGNYEPVPDVEAFLKQSAKIDARVFTSTELKNTIIFTTTMSVKIWHYLQSLISRYFPWYFKDSPLNEEETAILKTLLERYSPKYVAAIEEFAQRFDFRTQFVRKQLAGFENVFERQTLELKRNQIDDLERRLDDLKIQFSEYCRKINGLRIEEAGLVSKINSQNANADVDSELMEYFILNKSLNLLGVNDGMIEFIVETVIANFDPDVFDSAINNRESFFYRPYEGGEYANHAMTDERIEMLMREIFEKERLKLHTCAYFYLDFKQCIYGSERRYDYPEKYTKRGVPNQHLQHYNCFGNNGPLIMDALRRHDYIGGLALCVSSAQNMNMTEASTGTFFMQIILGDDPGQIIELPTGECVTPLEAAMWLEAEKKGEA